MFNKIINSKDRRKLMENFLSLSSIRVVSLILPLITLPYVLRTIGFKNYGITVLSWSLISYFTSVTDFSFKITATRDVAVFRDNKQKLNIIYSKVMILQSLLQLFSYVIITSVVYLYPPFYQERNVFWAAMPFLLGNTIFPDWFFLGMERMKYITFINLGVKIFFTIFVFILIKKQSDYWLYPLLQSLGFVLAGVLGQLILIKKYKIRFFWIKRRIILQTFKQNIPIFVNQFLPNLYNNTSTFLLGVLTNNTLVGIYDAIRKVINLCAVLIDITSNVFFPFINRKRNAFKKYKEMMTLLGIFLMLLPILFYKIVIWYLNISYSGSFSVILILSIGLFFLTQYDIYGINYFIIHRKDKIVMRNTIFASLIGFVIAFPLIHYFTIFGAAFTITFARILMGGGLYWKYQRENRGYVK